MGFGDFHDICKKTPLPLCPLIGPQSEITGTHYTQAQCYSRSIELANTIIFQGAAGFAHIIALIMTVIMIIHVRSKFTAVGMYSKNPTRALSPQDGKELTVLLAQAARKSQPSFTSTASSQSSPSL